MPIVPTLFSVLLFSASWDSRSKPATPPSVPTTGLDGLDQCRASHISVFTDDFGQLARYRDADGALGPPAADENRVVFYGDSTTDLWKLEESFPGKRYVNRGIGGQTTSQMLVRFVRM
jgi:acyl-CoA thioesterase-1